VPPTAAGAKALQAAIRTMHGVESTWVRSVRITEKIRGRVIWDGEVHVFDLIGHQSAQRCYAFCIAPDDPMQTYAVLDLGPVNDATSAVRAAIFVAARRGCSWSCSCASCRA
jgi:hypothetical protein